MYTMTFNGKKEIKVAVGYYYKYAPYVVFIIIIIIFLLLS